MAELKPVYLISGGDDARIDAWRARVRKRAESERGPGGHESYDARACEPAEVAAALATLSFDPGVRYVLVDDAGAWKLAALEPLFEAMAHPAPDTVLVLIVRGKPLKQLCGAVERGGGELRDYPAPRPWELPKWVVERGRECGLQVDAEAAKELIATVGDSQQRLGRELEKLALALHPAAQLTAPDVARLAAGDTAPKAYELADALAAGDLPVALRHAEALLAHGERPGALVWALARRLREVHRAAALLDTGLADAKVAEALGGPPWLAKRTVAQARGADRAALEHAVETLSDLEVELRGGSDAALGEEAAFSLALARATA